MLTAFTLENFKSYRRATLPLAPLTLLVGANASGKSNAIEGLQILSSIASGANISQAIERLESQGILRSPEDIFYSSKKALSFGCTLANRPPWSNLTITLHARDSGLLVKHESIFSPTSDSDTLYAVKVSGTKDNNVTVAYNPFIPAVTPPEIQCRAQQAIFTQLTTPARFADQYPQARNIIPLVAQIFQQTLNDILFIDPDPQQMRGYNALTGKAILQRQGKNISSVLHELCRDSDRKEQILAFVRSLPEQNISDLGFIKTERGDVLLRLTETFGGHDREFYAPSLSDGTLRVLAAAAALLSAPEGSLVVIEEIDNGIHPSRADMLMRNIHQIVTERHIRVLLTTHNPALMDALPLEAVPDVVYCYRDPDEGDSRLVRLADLDDYPRLIAQGDVGRLVTRGILERRFKQPPPPAEEQVAQALAWLDKLKAEVQES